MSVLERFRRDGQVALSTGETRGIGLAIAEALGEAARPSKAVCRRFLLILHSCRVRRVADRSMAA